MAKSNKNAAISNGRIQKRVAETVLQRKREVLLGGKTYYVAQPSIATLVMASELITSLPEMDLNSKDIVGAVLRNAKDCKGVAELCAVLILGAKECDKRRWWVFGPTKRETLSKRLYLNASPEDIRTAIEPMLFALNIGDFFALTTFLQGINLTKPTKVETPTEATASGQS